jgi:flagellar biosynthetic protein FlhB
MTAQNIDLQWFAAEDEGRTEEPSEFKIEKARKEGRVAKSQELNGAIVMIFSIITLAILAPWILDKCIEAYIYFFTRCTSEEIFSATNAAAFFTFFLKMVLPVSIVALIAGVASNIIQNKGFLFSTKPIQFQFSKVLPHVGQYLKKTMFSMQGAFNIAKSIGKVIVVILIAWNIISRNLPKLLTIIKTSGTIYNSMSLIASMGMQILISSAIFFLIISIPDYFVQKHEFVESLKMTKQEIKEEYKEMEGDPEVKSHLQQAQREMLQVNMPRAVAESDVVITNPTHFAVALKYDSSIQNSAPQVSAKGSDQLAQRIKQIARENDVPIVENRPLARGLYTDTQIGDIIPDTYIKAIAVVYAQLKKYSTS